MGLQLVCDWNRISVSGISDLAKSMQSMSASVLKFVLINILFIQFTWWWTWFCAKRNHFCPMVLGPHSPNQEQMCSWDCMLYSYTKWFWLSCRIKMFFFLIMILIKLLWINKQVFVYTWYNISCWKISTYFQMNDNDKNDLIRLFHILLVIVSASPCLIDNP